MLCYKEDESKKKDILRTVPSDLCTVLVCSIHAVKMIVNKILFMRTVPSDLYTV